MHELFLSGWKKYDYLKLKWIIKDKCSLIFKNLIGIKTNIVNNYQLLNWVFFII